VPESQLSIFLIQLLILLGMARTIGELFKRYGQPPVVGEILVGIILGPTILGRLSPSLYQNLFPPDPIQINMLNTLAWLGVLLLLLATGLEVDVSTAWRERGPALRIATIGVFFPLIVGFFFALSLPDHLLGRTDRIIFSLFLGTAIAISAIPIISRLLYDLNLLKTDLGLLILSAYAVNDLLGWIIFTVILGMATTGRFNPILILTILSATIVVAGLALTIGRRSIDRIISRLRLPGITLTFIFCLGLLMGALTQVIGIHAIFGFFLAGIMAGGARDLSERTRQVINQMVYAILVPIFFASIGLRVDFIKNFDPLLTFSITAIAILGKLFGAWLGAGGSDLSKEDRYALAIAHTPGGAMEVVIAVVALQFGLITHPIFVAIVFAAISSSLLVGPWFSWSIAQRKVINVLDFFLPRATIDDLKSGDRKGAIAEIAQAVGELERLPDSEAIFQAVWMREELMGTGLEKGVAVPHARIANLDRPVFTLARSTTGIDWDCRDGSPARIIFLLLTPKREEGAQVQILATLARIMSQKENQRRLIEAGDKEELIKVFTDILRSEGRMVRCAGS